MNKQQILEQISPAIELSFSNFEKHIGANTVQWTNRNQEFSQWTNRKQKRSQRNYVDIFPIKFISPICFHLYCVGNDNDDIPSEEHFENSKNQSL